MATPGRPPRPPAESYAASRQTLAVPRAPVRTRISAQIRHRQTASSQAGDPHTHQTAEDVTSQEARARWHHNHARLRPPPEPRNPQMPRGRYNKPGL
jgi:hypothetical protein